MEDGEGGFMGGGDRADHFHRNEAISAVADEGFLGEEDEEDYEDLYNDVNVGEGFHQSLNRNEEVGFRNEAEKKIEPSVSIPGVEVGSNENGNGNGKILKDEILDGFPKGLQDSGHREGELGVKTPASGGGITVRLGQCSSKLVETHGQIGNVTPPQAVELSQIPGKLGEVQGQFGNSNVQSFARQGGYETGVAGGGGSGSNFSNGGGPMGGGGAGSGGGGTVLFVGELHWWTTDAELESELSKYGPVKEVKFFDERASGKSKGYCQVEFYDPGAATVCKEGMNGHLFNGRPCVVAFASPHTVRRMGEAQVNKNQAMVAQVGGPRRGPGGGGGDVGGAGRGNSIPSGGNYQNFGRGGGAWGGRGVGGRGTMGQMRNRGGGMGGRGVTGNGGFGQGFQPAMGAVPPLLPPQAMMGQGFEQAGYGAMGRMAGYGSFPSGPVPPFSAGVLPPFPGVGGVGLPGVAPHVNPAFFGRGMPVNGMGMMPSVGVEGQGAGMWSDPSMGGWGADEQGGRGGDSSYGEDAASEHQYGEVGPERGGWSSAKEKDRVAERDMSGTSERRYRDDREYGWERDASKEKDVGADRDWSERRHRDDRETGWDRGRERERDRDRYREERERYSDHHRHRDREVEHEDEWDRGRSSRTHSKSRMPHEEEHRRRSRDPEHGKRRRLSSE